MKLESLTQIAHRITARWWTRGTRIILGSLAVIVVVTLLGLALARHIVRRGWPQAEGTLVLSGLNAPVTVVRDAHGVPHIYAEDAHDLFFVQGYVHAQDRFWQMELNRRRGRGTSAELLGDEALATDARWAILDLDEVSGRELARLDADAHASLEAYTAGVNAWLETHRRQMPFEFSILSWRGGDMPEPAPWTAEDSLIVSLALAWHVGAPWIDAQLAAQLVERVGPERGAFLLAGQPEDLSRFAEGVLQDIDKVVGSPPQRWALGSRITVVSGDETENGKPLLGVDLPTGLDLPAPWYVMAWRVGGAGAAGASVPGLPGLAIGSDDGAVGEAWTNPQYTLLSSLKELAPSPETLPWQRWVVAALLNTSEVLLPGGDQAPRTSAELQARQGDTFSARAERLVPFLVDVDPEGWRQERVTGMLRKWNYRIGDNNKEAPFFAVYQLELARAAFADELGDDLFGAYVSQSALYQAALDRIIEETDHQWWDDVRTPERERRPDILKQAYEPALEWIGRNYGDLHMLWEWDIVHGGRLHHALGDVWPWDQLLSRDLNPDGWSDTANASPGGLPCTGGMCIGGDLFRAKAVYGYRHVWDANDPTVLWFSLLPGQSGHPFNVHYDDLLDRWMVGEYVPLHLAPSPEEVVGAQGVLVLSPEEEHSQ